MRLIGLAGKARAGKDTINMTLQEFKNTGCYGFADPLRRAASEMFGLPVEEFYGAFPDREEEVTYWGFSRREMLQLLGTECARNVFRNDFWIRRAELHLTQLKCDTEFTMVITDVRFNNEASWIRKLGGVIVHIERPDSEEIESNQHASENGVRFWNGNGEMQGDIRFINDSPNLDELAVKVSNLYLEITENGFGNISFGN